MEIKTVTAETLGMGAALERINDGFQEVLANIQDPNTAAEATREIILKIKIKPKKDRSSCEYQIHMNTKLSGAKPVAGILFVGKQKGRLTAFESDPDQVGLFNEKEFNQQEKITVNEEKES